MQYTQITYDVAESVATITLSRPERMNAFTDVMMREVIDAFDRVDADDDVRAVIVTGAGERAFCAGADLGGGGDTFAKGRPIAPLREGDLVAFRSAGAYGAVMASEYNTRPLVPEVLVKGDQFAVIRARPSFDEILKRDTIPSWLE